MNEKTSRFIRERFGDFYTKEAHRVEPPASIEKREFGFVLFREKVMVRHKSFLNVEDLRNLLVKSVPLHVYYSTACYDAPEAEMESKGWLGAGLYFDIDADHIPTPCAKIHDKWVCVGCGLLGKGVTPERCPACGGKSFDEKSWPCETCLDSARQETIKLLDILTGDFGFGKDEVEVSFSGQRGYHVQIENDEANEMDPMARKEIADYITGTGLELEFYGLTRMRRRGSPMFLGPSLDDRGWRGRIARGTEKFLRNSTSRDLQSLGVRKKVADAIIANKEAIRRSWHSGGPWKMIKGTEFEGWSHIVKEGLKSESVKIDTVVTTDIHRLIRLAGTLHGKTGLMKLKFPLSNIEEFDPFKDAVAFKGGEATIIVDEAPRFRLGEESFGPFKRERVNLPMAAALILLCKDLAEAAE